MCLNSCLNWEFSILLLFLKINQVLHISGNGLVFNVACQWDGVRTDVQCALSTADEIISELSFSGLRSEIVLSRRAHNENLSVFRFCHSDCKITMTL